MTYVEIELVEATDCCDGCIFDAHTNTCPHEDMRCITGDSDRIWVIKGKTPIETVEET